MTDSAAPVAQAIQADSKDLGHKTFVGNLSFSTTTEDLKSIFSKAGEVTDAQVITRGSRSMGYGFVTFATEEAATKAISTLDKSTIKDRQINVELAKPSGGGRLPKEVAAAAAKSSATSVGQDGAVTQENGGAEEKRSKRPKKKSPKKRGPKTPAAAAEGTEEQAATSTTETNGAASAAPKKTRAPRQPKVKPAGPASTTMLFVANLSFSIKDDDLSSFFETEAGLKPVSSRVVIRKSGPSSGRSKGFAFVEMKDEADQKAALEKLDGKELQGRPVAIKVALAHEDNGKTEAGDETGLKSGEIIAS